MANYSIKQDQGPVPFGNTLNPTMTGSTVMAISFDGGIVVASDRSVFYGKMQRMQNNTRQFRVNDFCVVVFSGDYADFQWLQNLIERKQLELQRGTRKQYLKPEMVHAFLTALFYQRRSKFNPIWNTILVCGMQPVQFEANNFKPYIGVVNLYGVAYTPKYVATDFGAMLLNQLLETRFKSSPENLTKEQATDVLKSAMEISMYRNCKAGKSYDLTFVDRNGVHFTEPTTLTGNWDLAETFKHGRF